MRLFYTLFLVVWFCFQSSIGVAQWDDMNTGLSMDITGVNFDGDVGFVSGKDGIYYTQTGGMGSSSWSPYSITTSTADSIIYEQTQFNHCYSTNSIANDAVFFCGQDTVLNRAVIFSINPTNLDYMIVYTGSVGSSLSHMAYTAYGTRYYAVGDNGLVVSFLPSGTATVSSFAYTDSLISLNLYGNRYAFTSGNKLFYGTLSTSGLLTNLYDCSFSNDWVNDLQAYSSNSLYAVGNGYKVASVYCSLYGANVTYDENPLNGTAILKKGSEWIIGTDHGVYKNESANIEYQPTSNANFVNDFGEDAINTNRLYAACKNGVLLRTSNNGGGTIPNLGVEVSGSCLGQSSTISVESGSAQNNTIQWWIDGVLQSNYTGYGTGVLPLGQHVLSLTASNGYYTDSTSTIFHVVDTPDVTIPYTVIDDILCHKEPLVVEFASTEDSIQYSYYNATTNALLGETGELYGGFLSFVSDSISTSQPIIIEASSTYANCKQRFMDTIQLVVEHPKASFHVDLINANLNEQIGFHNQSFEATNFEWTFDGSPLFTSSSATDPLNSYTAAGHDSVHLLAWTDNFCYDSISKLSANIFENPIDEDSCWLNKHYSEANTNSNWNGVEQVSVEPSATGYFAMGNYKNSVVGTQHGVVDSLNLNGAYFAKYDENGTLKWRIKTPASPFDQNYSFYEAIENSSGEVYISGYLGDSFIDNEGDTTEMTVYTNGTATLIKLDAKGKLIWVRKVYKESNAWGLGLDQNENVFFIVNDYSSFDEINWSLNGNPMDTVVLPAYPIDAQFCFFKLTPQGDEIWHLPIANYINNSVGFLRIQTDSLNNIYLAGEMDSKVRVFNPGSLNTFNEECGSVCGGDRFFLFKLNENGNYIWSMRALYDYNNVKPSDMVVDEAGNSYITGGRGSALTMENANGTSTSATNGGKIFILKINSNGMTQWIKSNTNGYYGRGSQVDLVNDTLYMNGFVTAHSDPTINTSFLNGDGSSINLTIYKEDQMLTVLDTSGYMHRLITNGDNLGNAYTLQQNDLGSSGYFRLPNGKNLLSQTIRLTPYTDSIYFDDFGGELFWGQIPSYQQKMGVVNSFYESCNNTIYYPSYVSNQSHQICLGTNYNFPSGTVVISQDTVYQEMFLSNNGLDSTITHTIVAVPPDTLSVLVNSCWNNLYTFPDGTNAILFNDTLQTSVLTNSIGCDSIIHTEINVSMLDTSNVIENICIGETYTFPDASTASIFSDTLQTSTLTSSLGCDSLIQTQLYILNNVATVSNFAGGVLEANAGGSDYQWLNCSTGNLIAGETSPQYQYQQNGEYAVIVTENSCTDTSSCIYVNDVGLNDFFMANVEISPNPTTGVVQVNWNRLFEHVTVNVYDALGQKIESEKLINQISHSIELRGDPGVYFIELLVDGYSVRRPIIKI